MNFLKRIRPLQIGRVSQASYVGGTVIEPLPVPVDHRNQVRDILGNQLEKFRALPQLLVGPLPLHRVTNDAREHFAVEFTFHQVILRAFAHGLKRKCLLVGTGQHDDGHRGNRRLEFVINGDPLFVRP